MKYRRACHMRLKGLDMTDTVNWEARAVALELLSFSFRYPTSELAESVISGEWRAVCKDLAEVGYLTLPDDFAHGELAVDASGFVLEDTETLLHVLRTESTRLFIGAPDPAVPPFEGVWRAADEGVQALLFANPHTLEVTQFLKSCGVSQPEGVNEPLDHIATELAFLQYLSMLEAKMSLPFEEAVTIESLPGGSAAAAYTQFFEEHPCTWMTRFSAEVKEQTRLPYYRAAAQLLTAFLGE